MRYHNMKPSKFNEIAAIVIAHIGYFLLSVLIAIFSIAGIFAFALVFIEHDWFNLVGAGACAFIVWVLYSIRKATL